MKSTTVTINSAYTLFVRQHANPVTREAYDQTMKPFIAAIGEDCLLVDVDIFAILEWSALIRSEERGLAQATIYKHIKHVKAFFNWAQNIGLITGNPGKAIKQIKITKTRAEGQLMPKHVIRDLLRHIQGDARALAVVMFLLDTGCRRGGAAGLRVRDLNLRFRTAEVYEKDKTTRTVFFGPACTKALRAWLNSRKDVMTTDYVFSRDGGPITGAAIAQLFRRRTIEAGLGSLGPHRLRRQKIVTLLTEQENPRHVKDLVGHKRIETTLGYVPKDMSAVRALADKYAVGSESEDELREETGKIIRFAG